MNELREVKDLMLSAAQGVDVAPYRPMETFEDKHGRRPTIKELAEYIVEIRMIEAGVLLESVHEGATKAVAMAGDSYR